MENKLNVNVRSFSYKKGGIPEDTSGNGGGFVFDCRGILNPGRLEEFKELTGRDKEVIDYLESNTRINEFLKAIFAAVDITVEDYIARGFTNLEINFGCTGGQHRSVYSAEAMAKHLRNTYPKVEIKLRHVEQEKQRELTDKK